MQPGAIAALSGSRLAAAGAILSDASGASTSLGGTRVKVNNDYVPVLFSSTTQVKFLCPAFNPGTPLAIAVESDSGSTEPLASTMMESITLDLPARELERGKGLISFPAAKDLVMNRNFRIPAKPAQPGDPIVIWATGLGSGAESASGAVVVNISGIDAAVESVSAVPGQIGVYAIQTRVPAAVTFGDAGLYGSRWLPRMDGTLKQYRNDGGRSGPSVNPRPSSNAAHSGPPPGMRRFLIYGWHCKCTLMSSRMRSRLPMVPRCPSRSPAGSGGRLRDYP